jgi:hypothetical protein
MMAVQSADDASQAINRILEQGEGIGDDPLSSDAHFQRFTTILADLEHPIEKILDAALPVVTNPATRPNPHGYPVSLITRPKTVEVMELFNDCYHTMLVMLKSFFATHFNFYVPQPRCDAAMFYAAFFPLMTMVIRPLGEILCRMPAGEKFGEQHAGPSFELFEPLPIQTERSWYVGQLRSLARRTKRAVKCVESESQKQRMHYVYENLTSTYLHLDHIWRHGN